MEKRWMLKGTSMDIREIAGKAGTDVITTSLLIHREIKEPEEIKKFIRASIDDLFDGRQMKDMDNGISIIKKAIIEGKKIYIYGDYDVDGVISTFILFSALTRCGANVRFHIPHREDEGYGMNTERVRLLKEEGCEVILTCDNGIAAFEQIDEAKRLGMKVVVTDHHDIPFIEEEGEKKFIVPAADAIINPKQEQCTYPFKQLCGGGIAYKFAEVLYDEMGYDKGECRGFMQYAAISTICDVVDLVGENRVIAKNGLNMLNNTGNVGLKALIKECGLESKVVTAYHIGFIIGPCINATGRLETARISLELLLSKDSEEAETLAKRLRQLNEERQIMTSDSVERAVKIIQENNMLKNKVLVIYDKETHESIAGIVAGRIKEMYNLPTIVLTKGKEMPKGSARSIEGYNMFEELVKCKELLSKFGGHPMAAGMSLEEENIDAFRIKLDENCSLSEEELIPKIRIDQQLPLKYVSFKLVENIQKLEPFGKGNPSPVFAEKGVALVKAFLIGKEKNIVKLYFKSNESQNVFQGIYFEGESNFQEMIVKGYDIETYQKIINGSFSGVKLDIIYYPDVNEYNNTVTLQLIVKDMRLSN